MSLPRNPLSVSDHNQNMRNHPEFINPKITQDFARSIASKAKRGTYRLDKDFQGKKIRIDVFPTVFPPGASGKSISSELLCLSLDNLKGKDVLDIGSGTGIASILALLQGAKHVDAIDINPMAVSCTLHNARLNGVEHALTVFRSDLFEQVPRKRYDIIIANLPIVNFDPGNASEAIKSALYDPGLVTHRRLFSDGHRYIRKNGCITFTHANLQSGHTNAPNRDFTKLERLIDVSGYEIRERKQHEDLGYTWITYKITLKRTIGTIASNPI